MHCFFLLEGCAADAVTVVEVAVVECVNIFFGYDVLWNTLTRCPIANILFLFASQPCTGDLLTGQPQLHLLWHLRHMFDTKASQHLNHTAANNSVLAERHRPHEPVVQRDKTLLKVERPLVPVDQTGHHFERHEGINGPPISDAGSVLNNKHLRPCLNVGRATSAEVKVKPGKVHFSEVFAVVHVEEVVEVGCPAERVDDTLITQRETWQHLAEETCQDESENPVDIKEGNDEENKNEDVNVHCLNGTAEIFGGFSV